MAALREKVRWYKGEIEDGICWVAFWKEGRSWNAESFWIEDGSYEDGYIFEREDVERMAEILKTDHKAVMLNGYYTNCGTDENCRVPVERIVRGIEWNYYNRFNGLSYFYEQFVIKSTAEYVKMCN